LIVNQIQGMYAAGLDSEAIRRYLPCASGPEPRLTICPELRAYLLDRAAALDKQAAETDRQRTTLAVHLRQSEPSRLRGAERTGDDGLPGGRMTP
jgi:hypothetical protein